ncbi:MAG: hypothetical protein ABIM98_06905 [candidate division WOR-3 bacterium]
MNNLEILYPSYRELLMADEIMAKTFIIRAYGKTKNISEVVRIFKTIRKRGIKILRYKEKYL